MKMILSVLILMLAVCQAVPQKTMTRDEWLSARTRIYNGKTEGEALSAAERLFRLADGNDFTITHSASDLRATRDWIVYLVIMGQRGTDGWRVEARQKGNQVGVAVQLATGRISMMPGAYGSVYSEAGSAKQVEGDAIYTLFFRRLEYLLGLESEWLTCSRMQELITKGTAWGEIEALCNSFNVTDTHPGTGEALRGR